MKEEEKRKDEVKKVIDGSHRKEAMEKEIVVSPHGGDEITRKNPTTIDKAKKAIQKEQDSLDIEMERMKIRRHKLSTILGLLTKLEK